MLSYTGESTIECRTVPLHWHSTLIGRNYSFKLTSSACLQLSINLWKRLGLHNLRLRHTAYLDVHDVEFVMAAHGNQASGNRKGTERIRHVTDRLCGQSAFMVLSHWTTTVYCTVILKVRKTQSQCDTLRKNKR